MSPRKKIVYESILQLAKAARARSDAETGMLSDPLPNVSQALATVPESDVIQLISFGIFNPYGPTMFSVDLIRVSESGEALIVSTMLNPFQSTATAYAFLPAPMSGDTGLIGNCLTLLAQRNGHPDAPILLESAPTYVQLPQQSILTTDQLRLFAIGLLVAAGTERIGETAERLEQFTGRPWDRATEEMVSAARNLLQKRTDGEPAPQDNVPADYERWWRIASDLDHAREEMSHMQTAWRGALIFGGGR